MVEELTKSVGSKLLFSNISFAVNKAQRIALIARNGIGKSTLMDILMGKTDYDSGKITWRNDLKVKYLPQKIQGDEAMRQLEDVLPWDLLSEVNQKLQSSVLQTSADTGMEIAVVLDWAHNSIGYRASHIRKKVYSF